MAKIKQSDGRLLICDEDNKILHMIHRKIEFVNGRNDLVAEDNFIQTAALKLEKEKTFRPHKHLWHDSPQTKIAQESWVIISGSVRVFYFNLDNKLIHTDILNSGDCSITLFGGHTYEILEDNTLVYEFKTGPYYGQESDKIFIDKTCKDCGKQVMILKDGRCDECVAKVYRIPKDN